MTRQNLLISVLLLGILGAGVYSFLFVDFQNSRYDSLKLVAFLQDGQYDEFAKRAKLFVGFSCVDNLTPSALSSKLYYKFTRPDNLKLLALLKERQYDKLSKRILKREADYEKDVTKEIDFDLSIRALANNDPAHEALLTEWIQQQPDHHIPYLVRGYYYGSVGDSWRGGAFVNKTKDEQFGKLRFYHEKAYTDLMQSITFKPTTLAYSELLSLSSRVLGKVRIPFKVMGKEDFVQEGLAFQPASYEIRKSYLFKLMPQWGGSYEQIADFLEDARQYIDINPELKPLLGFEDYARAYNLRDKYDEAIALYTKALSFGEKTWYLLRRGSLHGRFDVYDKQMCDMNRALALWPHSHDALRSRAYAYEELGMYNKALVDYELASKLRPYADGINQNLGSLYYTLGRYQDAVDAYRRVVLFYGKHIASTWYALGYTLSYKLNDYAEAAKAYKKAIELKPTEPGYWYAYGVTLNSFLYDCEVIPVLHTHLSLCEASSNDKNCTDEYQQWSTQVSDSLVRLGKCPAYSQEEYQDPLYDI